MKTSRLATERPRMKFSSQKSWSQWLDRNHASSSGILLQFAKKASGLKSVTYAEAVEAALCYGWIDGQVRKLDDDYYLQMFTPRTRSSIWSQVNRAKALKLIEQKQMQPAGLAAIAQAKANSRWEAAYEAQSKATVPGELTAASKENAAAAEFFRSLDSKNRYAIVFRIQTAKKPETRVVRVQKFVGMLERGEKIHA